MTDPGTAFAPDRAAAHAALDAFLPHAGEEYARWRGHDPGPGQRGHVSALSPWVKLRLLDEITIARAVLSRHDAAAAEKFLTEVFWRTYWKGWMELRPSVWREYMRDLKRLENDLQTQSGLRHRWEEACLGQTGIPPFDAWARELAETGYLHNHARMWFASIWIFTLDLPWQLGADFFLRHLLDGDAAVNTLSWRWVAGIQTPGKTYLATADNIAAHTGGRFPDVAGLAQVAKPREAGAPPPPRHLPDCPTPRITGRCGILLHGDDVDLARLLPLAPDPVAIAYADATDGHSPRAMAPDVARFRRDAARAEGATETVESADAIGNWARAQDLDLILAPYAPVGPMQDMLQAHAVKDDAVPLVQYRRPLDTAAWPLATKGFFPFRKHIPDLIGEFVRSPARG